MKIFFRTPCPVCFFVGGGGVILEYLDIHQDRAIFMCDECNSTWTSKANISYDTDESNRIFGDELQLGPSSNNFFKNFKLIQNELLNGDTITFRSSFLAEKKLRLIEANITLQAILR
ncbi:MAG: hypothetical protein HC933_07400 [Pleurocapsa sp. SU_196_0]|nr:hypothetical protein [Pleurocapsa sp. SU_196_0]